MSWVLKRNALFTTVFHRYATNTLLNTVIIRTVVVIRIRSVYQCTIMLTLWCWALLYTRVSQTLQLYHPIFQLSQKIKDRSLILENNYKNSCNNVTFFNPIELKNRPRFCSMILFPLDVKQAPEVAWNIAKFHVLAIISSKKILFYNTPSKTYNWLCKYMQWTTYFT